MVHQLKPTSCSVTVNQTDSKLLTHVAHSSLKTLTPVYKPRSGISCKYTGCVCFEEGAPEAAARGWEGPGAAESAAGGSAPGGVSSASSPSTPGGLQQCGVATLQARCHVRHTLHASMVTPEKLHRLPVCKPSTCVWDEPFPQEAVHMPGNIDGRMTEAQLSLWLAE